MNNPIQEYQVYRHALVVRIAMRFNKSGTSVWQLYAIEIEPPCKTTHVIGYYNPSIRIMAQLLTPHMFGALILYVSGGTHSFMSIPNDIFLRNFFVASLLTFRVKNYNFFPYYVVMPELGYKPGIQNSESK